MPPEEKQTDEEAMAAIVAKASEEPGDGSTGDPLALLTDEEREALKEDDFIETDDDTGEELVLDDPVDPVEPVVETTSEPDVEPVVAAQPAQRAESPTVTITPEQMQAHVDGFKTESEEAFQKFDDGELSSEEFRKALADLETKQNEVRNTFAAEQAQVKLVTDNEAQAWNAASGDFMTANPELGAPEHLQGFDQMVRFVTRTAKGTESYPQMLEKAKKLYAIEAEDSGTPLTKAAPKADPDPVIPKVEGKALPKPGQTLSNIPAAAVSPAADGKYAALEELMENGTPDQIEAVLGRMNPEDAENFASGL